MENTKKITLGKQARLLGILLTVTILLLLPLIAMQFSNEVYWTKADFAVAGTLLLSAGLGCEFIFRKTKMARFRFIFCSILFIAFFLIWAELAVGIFGTPFAGS